MHDGRDVDLVVVGAGAAGLTAALVAAHHGLKPLILEKTRFVGGTTALSGGALWIPDSPQARARGAGPDVDAAGRYLDALVGERAPRHLRETYLHAGPQMIDYLDRHGGIRFELAPAELDYRSDLPGTSSNRVLRPLPFDGRRLGKAFDRIARPLPELMIGGMMVTRPEAATLLTLPSPRALGLAARLFTRYATDRMRHSRGTRLVLGNALVAQLFRAVLEARIPILFECVPEELLVDAQRVVGVRIREAGREAAIHARRGVVLAGGGFPGSDEMRARLLPAPPPKFTPAWAAASGDTLALAERAGAAFQAGGDNALWFPSSIMNRHDGSTAVYPHIVLDRAKPGLIAVAADGRRFVDEAVSYHEFVRAMYQAHARGVTAVPAHLVCDRRFLWKYGLGMIRPHTCRLARYVRLGYLVQAASIEELAAKAGLDRAGLVDTVARHNAFARAGFDDDFGKGSRAYDRSNGDSSHHPNPCLGPIASPPYYSVVVWPTPLATSWGIRINEWSQALDHNGVPIEGLYACGNDMQSITGGEYPGPGGQIGPAMTFGYLAAKHAANSRTSH